MSNIKIVRSAKLICHFFLTNSDVPPAAAGSRGGYTADFRPVMDILPRNRQEYGHPAKLPQRWSVYAHKKLALPLSAAAFAVRHRAGRQPGRWRHWPPYGANRRGRRNRPPSLRQYRRITLLPPFLPLPPRPTASVNGRESSRCFWRVLPSPTRCLMCMCRAPPEEQQRISAGIEVADEVELARLLEDYTS